MALPVGGEGAWRQSAEMEVVTPVDRRDPRVWENLDIKNQNTRDRGKTFLKYSITPPLIEGEPGWSVAPWADKGVGDRSRLVSWYGRFPPVPPLPHPPEARFTCRKHKHYSLLLLRRGNLVVVGERGTGEWWLLPQAPGSLFHLHEP